MEYSYLKFYVLVNVLPVGETQFLKLLKYHMGNRTKYYPEGRSRRHSSAEVSSICRNHQKLSLPSIYTF